MQESRGGVTSTFIVTLDAGEGYFDGDTSKHTKDITVTNGETYGELPTPAIGAASFKGWYTETNKNGTKITSNTVVNLVENQTLYAGYGGSYYVTD